MLRRAVATIQADRQAGSPVCGAGAQFICGVWPSRLPYSTIFILWYLYLSVVFHYKYQSYKYERNTAVHMPHGSFSRATVKRWTTWEITWQFVPQFQVLGHLCKTLLCPLILYFVLCTLATTLRHRALEPAASPGRHPQLCETISRWRSHFQLFTWSFSFLSTWSFEYIFPFFSYPN